VDTERALLGAIHADPSDHGARLALADWLEEAGRTEQAELLRLHVRQMTKEGTREELRRLNALLAAGVRPVVPEVVNSIGMRLALVPAGAFRMGAADEGERYPDHERPRHRVRITRPFYTGVFPVTQAQYEEVVGLNPSRFQRRKVKAPVGQIDPAHFPVDGVTWGEAFWYCVRLTRLPAEKEAGRAYRLPTEAEWEYACRGGAAFHQVFHFGDHLSAHQANIYGSSPNLERTCAVGSYPPNAFGLYDMHGNVYEWCEDWYDAGYCEGSPTEDPRGPPEGQHRVARGGCWRFSAEAARSAARHFREPTERTATLGFRLVMTPVEKRPWRDRP
jgi:uncharacterized protein (TIGR02996 family)